MEEGFEGRRAARMNSLDFDIEVYGNVLLVGMRRVEDGKIIILEESDRSTIDKDWLRRILLTHRMFGFNSMGYDAPLLWYFLTKDPSLAQMKIASDKIIKGRLRWWEVEEALDIHIPWDFKKNHVDLIEPQPNPVAGLKALHARLHGTTIRELPYHEAMLLSHEQIDKLREYLHNDLDATRMLREALAEPLALREALGIDLGIDLRSKSDSQMGLAIIKKRVEDFLGNKVKKADLKPGLSFRYTAPEYIKFETSQLSDILSGIQKHDFIIGGDGKVELPDWLSKEKIEIGLSIFQMGLGGLHSMESNRSVKADDLHVIVSCDVASYYPAIILSLGLYPPATGPAFCVAYEGIRKDRLKAKKVKDTVRDKGFKIALNGGGFGNLGQRFSITFAPHLLIATTLTGQLSLLMLIERAFLAGIGTISANTDGAEFFCPRESYAGMKLNDEGGITNRLNPSKLADICDQWERDTKFDLEFVEYVGLYNQSVNSYFAIKADGNHKRKGPISNPWNPDKSDFDPRGQLMKNPQTTICSDAALARIKDGTPVSETIRNCRDIKQFVTVIKATGGATWRGEYLGKVVRFYYGLGGDPIFKATPHASTGNFAKVPKSDGAIECMRLPDEFPDDIDYEKYIAEAETILSDVGFYGAKVVPPKPIRVTKANRQLVFEWLTAA
ncbi:hypothetical protein NKJ28_00160 [Mesorhizobium sp. M0145]|uniref:hypothetical protein n=1 Tax=Mesorhizobium sp. M0145 TaxID=2956895 RepID=UPI00333C9E9F